MNQDNPTPPFNYQPPGDPHPQFNMAPDRESLFQKFKKNWRKVLHDAVIFLGIPILIAFLLSAFVIQSYQVDGESMETTLQNHDRLIVYKFPRTVARLTRHQYVPKRGEIVIFNQTGLPDIYYQKQLIKRVIGLPGERVVVSNGTITVYNKAHPMGFDPDKTVGYKINVPTGPGNMSSAGVTLGPNEIFVCGDNRVNSEDSRYFGPVQLNNVVGVLALRILPINKAESF